MPLEYNVLRFGSKSSPSVSIMGLDILSEASSNRPRRSITTGRGERPGHRRQSRRGLSASAVPEPTSMASWSERSLWTSIAVSGVENFAGCPSTRSESMNPSVLRAHFRVTKGRCCSWAVMNRRFRARLSAAMMPSATSIPASRIMRMPRPATSLKGSPAPTTTRGIPVSMMSLAQGGVLP